MSPEEIIEAYGVLVQEGNNYAAQEAAKVGNSQRSIGGLAEAVANPSGQTSGLANYTYNRLLRPTVDTIAANLTTAGLSQGMDRYLKDQLTAAKNAYEDAKNRYTVAASSGGGGGNGGTDPYNERTFGTGDENPVNQIAYTAAGTIISTGTSGNGVFDIVVADGKGGSEIHQYYGPSREEALSKYYRDYGGGPASSSNNSGSGGNGVSGGGGGGGGAGGR